MARSGPCAARSSPPTPSAEDVSEVAHARLTRPLVHTPGIIGMGGGGSAITDSVLILGLPSNPNDSKAPWGN
jgi:hypothetical protein